MVNKEIAELSVLQSITTTETITSPSNARVRSTMKLRDAAVRRETGLTLIDGQREIQRCLTAKKEIVEIFFDADSFASLSDTDKKNFELLLREASAQHASLTPLSTRPFSKIAFGNRNEGLVAVARFHAGALADFQASSKMNHFLFSMELKSRATLAPFSDQLMPLALVASFFVEKEPTPPTRLSFVRASGPYLVCRLPAIQRLQLFNGALLANKILLPPRPMVPLTGMPLNLQTNQPCCLEARHTEFLLSGSRLLPKKI